MKLLFALLTVSSDSLYSPMCPVEVGTMARHKLSRDEQADGLRKALRSRKTPVWLKPSIRRFLRKLESRKNKPSVPSVLDGKASCGEGSIGDSA